MIAKCERRKLCKELIEAIRTESKDGKVRYYIATNASRKEMTALLKDAAAGERNRSEITNERHINLLERWWTEAESNSEAAS